MKKEQFEFFLVCAVLAIGILFLRLTAEYPDGLVTLAGNMTEMLWGLIDALGLASLLNKLSLIPPFVLIIIGGLIQIVLGLFVLSICKDTMEQGAMLVLKKGGELLQYGMTLYLFVCSLLFIFIYSVIGAPFGILIILLLHIASFFGGIPLAIYIGYMTEELLGIRGRTVTYFLLGRFIMVLCESIFGVGTAFLLFVFPVCSLGSVFLLFLYRKVLRIRFPVCFPKGPGKESFDRGRIRDIIGRGTKLENEDR